VSLAATAVYYTNWNCDEDFVNLYYELSEEDSFACGSLLQPKKVRRPKYFVRYELSNTQDFRKIILFFWGEGKHGALVEWY
jgi:hypothetical protein